MKLRKLLVQRKNQLDNEKNILSKQMNKEKDKAFACIQDYRERLDQFKNIGLLSPDDIIDET